MKRIFLIISITVIAGFAIFTQYVDKGNDDKTYMESIKNIDKKQDGQKQHDYKLSRALFSKEPVNKKLEVKKIKHVINQENIEKDAKDKEESLREEIKSLKKQIENLEKNQNVPSSYFTSPPEEMSDVLKELGFSDTEISMLEEFKENMGKELKDFLSSSINQQLNGNKENGVNRLGSFLEIHKKHSALVKDYLGQEKYKLYSENQHRWKPPTVVNIPNQLSK